MNNSIKIIIGLSLLWATANQAMAADQVVNTDGLVRAGTVSVTHVDTLSGLELALKAEAEKKNALYFKIISAGGDNFFYGNAAIYN